MKIRRRPDLEGESKCLKLRIAHALPLVVMVSPRNQVVVAGNPVLARRLAVARRLVAVQTRRIKLISEYGQSRKISVRENVDFQRAFSRERRVLPVRARACFAGRGR